MTYFFSQLPLIFIRYGLPLLWLLWSPKMWNFIYLASKAALNIEMLLVLRAKRTKKIATVRCRKPKWFWPKWAKGPPHVLWEVSFGFWVTWSISCWQENYKSVFFPKLQFLNDKLQLYPKKLFGTLAKLFWFPSLKSKRFPQFFLVRGKSERIYKI